MNRKSTSNGSAAMRHLDIIVPIYKNAELLRACVDSLVQHIGEIADREPRIILINDSPGDEGVESLLDEYLAAKPDLMVLHNEENVGFVGSVNRGLEISQRDERDVLLVNSDTQTFPRTLSELLKSAHADPQIGFACPRSNNASICSLPHFFGGSLPTPEQSYQRWIEMSRTMPSYHFSPTAVGFYMFIAHKVLANHGGLRSDFGLGYEEENDLVMRAGMLGSRAVIVNRAFAYHAGSASFNLKDLDLSTHKHGNLLKLTALHPQFLPLVSRYENSPHYRAERILSGLLKDQDGRIKIAFDLSGMGQHYNGTNELAVSALRSMAKRQGHRIRLTGVASKESFSIHELDEIPGLHREEVGATTLHGIAIRLAQPFDLHQINTLESLAPINVFAMLDTISEDCGRLAIDGSFLEIWDHVAKHANGLVFISRFSEQTFCNRHRAALEVPRLARLLPTQASSYPKPPAISARDHILVVGNHFAHKGADVAARVIAAAFPTIKVVVLGSENIQSANLTIYRAGVLEPALVDRLFADASLVVLPSHVEGFGLGFMHAISAGLPIVARRIPATDEILATLDEVTGVFVFEDNSGLVRACALALNCAESRAKYDRASSWDDWADELTEFCVSLASRGDVFHRLVERIAAGDCLRRAARGDLIAREAERKPPEVASVPVLSTSKSVDLKTLLELEGKTFVEHAYATILRRPADQSGLDAYVKQLAGGQHKLDVLESLANSPEGRQRDVSLPNFDQMIRRLHKARRPLLKRVFMR
jgi:GT2 family glycosyltransferase